MSKIGGTDLASYASDDLNLKSVYSEGTYISGDTTYTITSMAAMQGNTTIKTVEMPSTVTSLPASCFSGCTALKSVSFPGIKTIQDYAFRNCSALTGTLTIPSGAYVNNQAFNGCTGVTTLVIHTGTTDNPTSFYGDAFLNMGNVTKVEIVDGGSTKIPDNTFKGAAFKDGVDLNIDKAITTIGNYAFSSAKFDGFSFFFSSEPFTPTAINAVKANADSHSAAHYNDDSYYDLQGRKVEFPSTGIYIHHGRKVVITHKPQSLNL